MDMQHLDITNVDTLTGNLVQSADIISTNNAFLQDVEIRGRFILDPMATIIINGVTMSPLDIGAPPSPILDYGLESRITTSEITIQALEKENKILKERLDDLQNKMESVSLWNQI